MTSRLIGFGVFMKRSAVMLGVKARQNNQGLMAIGVSPPMTPLE
jgi:hypothetical protein